MVCWLSLGYVRHITFFFGLTLLSGPEFRSGGGNISNEDLKNFGPALRWMTYEAMALGLRIEPYEGSWTDLELTKSLTAVWRILEIFPLPSLTYKDANKTSLKYVDVELSAFFASSKSRRLTQYLVDRISALAERFKRAS